MGRPRLTGTDRRRQIMQVAMKLFAQQGFAGTTTRQIAEQARVNEAIIFRHFPAKEKLYWAILEDKCLSGGGRQRLEQALVTGADDRTAFAAIAEDILRRISADTTLTRLLLFSALENHRLSQRFFRTYITKYYQVVADHIRNRIGQKSFRRVDPLLAARGFLGMLIYHVWIQELFGGKRYQKFGLKQVSKTLADVWLKGMLAHNGGN